MRKPFFLFLVLAGCSAAQVQPGQPAVPAPVARQLSVSLVRQLQVPVRPDRRRSWMAPAAGGTSPLLYLSDGSAGTVYVLDYKNGKQVGELTGISGPSNMCVDAKGDVYIVFGSGSIDEYAHGGTKVLNTYDPGGEIVGCSVDAKGDLAATGFDPAQVTVYAGGNSSKSTVYSSSDCEFLWAMGYDDKGNLIGEGETSQITVCAVLAGSKSMTTLSMQGITIYFPDGTMWDGKHIALGDQEANKQFVTGLVPATLSGSTLSSSGEVVLTDTCDSDYNDVVNPFIVGTKNTPVNHKRAKVVLGANVWCSGTSTQIDFWHYATGGNPYKDYTLSFEPGGWAVSFGK